MVTNECVIHRRADDETLIFKSAECLQEPPTEGVYLCSDPVSTYYIFTTYDSDRNDKLLNTKAMFSFCLLC